MKHFNRGAIAALLGIEPEAVRLVEVDVGGGFGVRGELYPEDVLIPFAARLLGRPVKWIEDRAEHLVAANHAREQVHEIEITATADGRLLTLSGTYWCDQGAYVRTQGILPTLLPAHHLPGPYRWDAFCVRRPRGAHEPHARRHLSRARDDRGDVRARAHARPRRGRARPRPRRAAPPQPRDAGRDAVRLRPRPARAADRLRHGRLPGLLRAAARRARATSDLQAERAQRREAGEAVGIGLAAGVELGAIGPFEEATISGLADGTFVVRAGVASLGQGVETVVAQIAADELGVPASARHGAPPRHRRRRLGLRLVREPQHGARRQRRRARRAGAAPPRGRGPRCPHGGRRLRRRVRRSARRCRGVRSSWRRSARCPAGSRRRTRRSRSAPRCPSSQVDRETGRVTPLRHVVAHDVGRAINPALVHGQLAGGAAQGIAGALYEELPYDEEGQPLAVSLADYLMPTARRAAGRRRRS